MREAKAKGRGVLVFTGHFGFWEIQALVHALEIEPMAVLARPLDNRAAARSARSACAVRPATASSIAAVRSAACCARWRRTTRVGDPDRSAPAQRGRRLRGLLQSSGRNDVGAGGAGVEDRRAGRPDLCAAAAGRTVPHGLRASGRAAARAGRSQRSASSRSAALTCSRCTCGAIRSCGCGCIGAGATCRPTPSVGPMFPAGGDDPVERWMISGPDAPSRLVVRLPNWLGDAVMAIPALVAVRDAFPQAHLALAGEPSVLPVFEEESDVRPAGTARASIKRTAAARAARGRLRRRPSADQLVSKCVGRATERDPERWGYAAGAAVRC